MHSLTKTTTTETFLEAQGLKYITEEGRSFEVPEYHRLPIVDVDNHDLVKPCLILRKHFTDYDDKVSRASIINQNILLYKTPEGDYKVLNGFHSLVLTMTYQTPVKARIVNQLPCTLGVI